MEEREAEQQNQYILSSSHLIFWVGISLLPNIWGCWKIKKKKKKRWRLWRFFENFKIQWQWEWFFLGGGDFEGDYFFAFSPYCSPIQNALCLLIPRGAWCATVHEVAKSWIWLSDCTDIPVLQPWRTGPFLAPGASWIPVDPLSPHTLVFN